MRASCDRNLRLSPLPLRSESVTSKAPSPSKTALQTVAGDHHWHWSSDGDVWRMKWNDASERARHLQFVDELADDLFPWEVAMVDDDTLEIEADEVRPWSSFSWREARRATVAGLFESLGTYLRTLHDHGAPEGFGWPDAPTFRHTFNAFMAAEFESVHRRLQSLDEPLFREEAIEALASLRRELSAFHPHGRSAWTIGRLTADRLAVSRTPTRLRACVDFGDVALRPPEFDLASLRIEGLLCGEQSLADRSFWKGYGAALTRDLDRRISYFQRLLDLKRRLAAAIHHSERRL